MPNGSPVRMRTGPQSIETAPPADGPRVELPLFLPARCSPLRRGLKSGIVESSRTSTHSAGSRPSLAMTEILFDQITDDGPLGSQAALHRDVLCQGYGSRRR